MADTVLLRGSPLAQAIRARITDRVAALTDQGVVPRLAVVVASDEPAVLQYAQSKSRSADKLGIAYEVVAFDPADGQAALEDTLGWLSDRSDVHGVLLELPVAKGLDAERALDRLSPLKDVDGMTAGNVGLVEIGREAAAICAATPLACIQLAEQAMPVAGRRVTVVGRGRTVGRVLIPMLLNRDATVTVCHSRTRDLAEAIAPAEIVFVAVGRPGLITGAHLRPGQVVIDAGINMVPDGEGGEKMVGDVAADSVLGLASALTPVPGGVGPLTSTLIFDNLLRAIDLQQGKPVS